MLRYLCTIFNSRIKEADNFEIGWKYSQDNWYASATLFSSHFDNYLAVKETRALIDKEGLNECVRKGDCDLTTGDFDDRTEEFFSTRFRHTNFSDVTNRGFELAIKKVLTKELEAGFSVGINDLDSPSDFVFTDSNPLELKGYYKKFLPNLPSKPWVKLKARYVTNKPKVEQREGFDPFFTADLYVGGDYKKLSWNAGIRNLFDEVYHEPYSALDGLERSFNIGVNYNF